MNSTLAFQIFESNHSNVSLTTSSSNRILSAVDSLLGFVGAVGNGVMLFALTKSTQLPNKDSKKLVQNQLVCDTVCGFFIGVTYLVNVVESDSREFSSAFCFIVERELLFRFALNASTVNLTLISLEKYLATVHPNFSQPIHRKKSLKTRLDIRLEFWTCDNISAHFEHDQRSQRSVCELLFFGRSDASIRCCLFHTDMLYSGDDLRVQLHISGRHHQTEIEDNIIESE